MIMIRFVQAGLSPDAQIRSLQNHVQLIQSGGRVGVREEHKSNLITNKSVDRQQI